jgi:transposase
VCGKKIHHWYKDFLSGFSGEDEQRKLHQYDTEDIDVIDRITRKPKIVLVPVFKPWNFGEDMSMDDKNIGGIGYIIFRNKKTGKIALMTATTKLKILKKILYLLPSELSFGVKKVTRDMAYGYEWMIREIFPCAIQIADKFHVIKHALDALQDVRARYRQILLTARRKAYEEHKKEEAERRRECAEKNKPYKKKTFGYKEPELRNGETHLELLSKSRYLLFKFSREWEDYQRERAEILFSEYPEIKTAYERICEFRDWMKKENVGKDTLYLQTELNDWYKKTDEDDIEEIMNFKSLTERNITSILNYFDQGDTNADAEGLNSQIQKFIHMNGGVKDRDFLA